MFGSFVTSSVTAVGGTIHVPEVAVSFSGGGFSNTVHLSYQFCVWSLLTSYLMKFSRPAYQDAVVEDFLQNKLPKGRYAGLFNP